jgi:hypothetical protein
MIIFRFEDCQFKLNPCLDKFQEVCKEKLRKINVKKRRSWYMASAWQFSEILVINSYNSPK